MLSATQNNSFCSVTKQFTGTIINFKVIFIKTSKILFRRLSALRRNRHIIAFKYSRVTDSIICSN